MGLISTEARHIGDPQTQAGGTSVASLLPIQIADGPEAVSPLWITGQEHHMSGHRGSRLTSWRSCDRGGGGQLD
jgi:hypothetical protein